MFCRCLTVLADDGVGVGDSPVSCGLKPLRPIFLEHRGYGPHEQRSILQMNDGENGVNWPLGVPAGDSKT